MLLNWIYFFAGISVFALALFICAVVSDWLEKRDLRRHADVDAMDGLDALRKIQRKEIGTAKW
jgi:hypothetical protein